MHQISMFPVLLVDEYPADRTQSQDLMLIGIDGQNRRYALKTTDDAPLLPLTEWVCYHLCRLCHIPTPEFAIVERLNGTLAFGSRWAEGAWQASPATASFDELIQRIADTKDNISAMFALDAFMPNEDRHLGNILFLDACASALAFDWSRTHLFHPWPWPPGCNSEQVWRWLQTESLTFPDSIAKVLDRLQAISETQLAQIFDAAPPEWRAGFNVPAAVQWWQAHRHERARQATEILRPRP